MTATQKHRLAYTSDMNICTLCGETITDMDAGFSPAMLGKSHSCGGRWIRPALLAAAPALLEACKLADAALVENGFYPCVESPEADCNGECENCKANAAHEACLAAIALAQGERGAK